MPIFVNLILNTLATISVTCWSRRPDGGRGSGVQYCALNTESDDHVTRPRDTLAFLLPIAHSSTAVFLFLF